MKSFNQHTDKDLTEEVFYWYIIKGNTEKGKVAHVGTERQLKLKIRKPTFPPNHVLLKSRKDLKIGDKWKGSYIPEEVEIDERYYFNIGRGVYYMSPDSHKIDHKKEDKNGYPNALEV